MRTEDDLHAHLGLAPDLILWVFGVRTASSTPFCKNIHARPTAVTLEMVCSQMWCCITASLLAQDTKYVITALDIDHRLRLVRPGVSNMRPVAHNQPAKWSNLGPLSIFSLSFLPLLFFFPFCSFFIFLSFFFILSFICSFFPPSVLSFFCSQRKE